MSVNKVILVGNLGKDPETRYTPSGVAVCTFPIATSERFKDKQGQQQERTEWHNIVVWRNQAEACGKYLHKGKQVYIEGKIQSRKYQDRDGNDRFITEIVADQVQFLGQNGGGNGGGQQSQGGQQRPQGQQPQSQGGQQQRPPQQPQGQPQGGYQQAPPQQPQSGGGGDDGYQPFGDDDIPFAHLPYWREFVK